MRPRFIGDINFLKNWISWKRKMKHKGLVFAILVAGFLVGCRKPTIDTPDPQSWFIESYTDGVVTVQHEGMRYKAKCDNSRSVNADPFADPNNFLSFRTCDFVVRIVGRNVQPVESKQEDSSGWTITMQQVGSALVLRRWHDEHTGWKQEEFVITAVTKKAEGE